MSHFFVLPRAAPYNRLMDQISFVGRHNETGTITNALQALGAPRSEAMVLGASGGIAFGYFIFAYTGQLPHVALLPRNTFSPFLRALDNLGIRRESRETVNPEKAEVNLLLELDSGHAVLVWLDIFSLPYRNECANGMWLVSPILVVGYQGDSFFLADGPGPAVAIDRAALAAARGKIKKERYRMMVLEKPDEDRLVEGLSNGVETCAALFLDKPPAGSVNNFGIAGMRNCAKALTDERTASGWAKKFVGPLATLQSLAGQVGQPGCFDWIDTWGTGPSADRGTYAEFLVEASSILGRRHLTESADLFLASAKLWSAIAESCLPDDVPELALLKARKRTYAYCRPTDPSRAQRRSEVKEAWQIASEIPELETLARDIRQEMAKSMSQIADLEHEAAQLLRA
jgi:hypothetical protein